MYEIKTWNIFERMLAISQELKPVQRTLTIEKGNGLRYAALSERTVMEAVKPLEYQYRVYSYPAKRVRTSQMVHRKYTDPMGRTYSADTMVDRIDVTYRFVNIDRPEEYIEVDSFGTGIDTGEKGPGKAMTYADKYAIMKAYKLLAEDAAEDSDWIGASHEDTADQLSDRTPRLSERSAPASAAADTALDTQDLKHDKTPCEESREASEQNKSLSGPTSKETTDGNSNEAVPTIEEAKAFIVPIGSHQGKSLGEVLALNRRMVEFYAGDQFKNPKYPELKQAAQRLIQSLA